MRFNTGKQSCQATSCHKRSISTPLKPQLPDQSKSGRRQRPQQGTHKLTEPRPGRKGSSNLCCASRLNNSSTSQNGHKHAKHIFHASPDGANQATAGGLAKGPSQLRPRPWQHVKWLTDFARASSRNYAVKPLARHCEERPAFAKAQAHKQARLVCYRQAETAKIQEDKLQHKGNLPPLARSFRTWSCGLQERRTRITSQSRARVSRLGASKAIWAGLHKAFLNPGLKPKRPSC